MIVYSDVDPFVCRWLENLVKAGHLASGDVWCQDIRKTDAIDLELVDQYHAFAGIGGWPLALDLAGWPAGVPVWTASCPCQPFSVAGHGRGLEDDRHLWPVLRALVAECLPPVIFGEQVASPAGRSWLDAVSISLEDLGYAVGSADLCASGVGAPHVRQRLFFGAVRLADREGVRRTARRMYQARYANGPVQPGRQGNDRGMADDRVERREGERLRLLQGESRQEGPEAPGRGPSRGLGYTDGERARGNGRAGSRAQATSAGERIEDRGQRDGAVAPGAVRGFWADAEWIPCRDGKHRPAEPGVHPLASGVPGRVGRLRAAGNAIVPQVAAEFVTAFMECLR